MPVRCSDQYRKRHPSPALIAPRLQGETCDCSKTALRHTERLTERIFGTRVLGGAECASRQTTSPGNPIRQVKFVLATGLDWLNFGDVFVWPFGGALVNAVYH
jgi:hypothetical protein